MRDMAHSICLIKLFQITMRKKFRFFVSDYLKTAEDKGENVLPYLVDMDLGYCTCPISRDGLPCKRQHAVVKQHSLRTQNFFPISNSCDRKLYATIANSSSLPLECYLALGETNDDYSVTDENNTRDVSVNNVVTVQISEEFGDATVQTSNDADADVVTYGSSEEAAKEALTEAFEPKYDRRIRIICKA